MKETQYWLELKEKARVTAIEELKVILLQSNDYVKLEKLRRIK